MRHTPGKWRVEDWQYQLRGGGVVYNKPTIVTETDAIAEVCTLCPGLDIPRTEERQANARLIASSPDLLATLQKIVDIQPLETAGTYDMGMALAEIRQIARQAIRAATGEGE